jgi:hypothetical protein
MSSASSLAGANPRQSPALPAAPVVSSRRIRAVALFLATLLVVLGFRLSPEKAWANKDFVSYWAAGQLLLRHHNPYDESSVLRREEQVGYKFPRALIMRNPPWALIWALPLGPFGTRGTGLFWMLGIIGSIRVSILLIYRLLGKPPGRYHFYAYLLPPALACVLAGQSSSLLLLGLTLFLFFVNKRPFLAGIGLGLCAIKPHLFLPFIAVLLVWILSKRAWPLLAGTVFAIGMPLAVVLYFDPSVMSHYLSYVSQSGVNQELIPCTSAIPRALFFLLFRRDVPWLQLVPVAVGCCWALWFYRRHRGNWDWQTHGSTLTVVSLIVAPYAWLVDEVILFPALIGAMYYAATAGRSILPLAVVAAIGNAELAFMVELASPFYIWTGLAWFGWYVWATRPVQNLRDRGLSVIESEYL